MFNSTLRAYVLLVVSTVCMSTIAHTQELASFIESIKAKANARGISEATLKYLDSAVIIDRVLELDQKQPEFSLNFANYLNLVINKKRITQGQKHVRAYDELFAQVYKKYGVPKNILVAFWGLESNYSETTGVFPLLDAMVTLSYDKRRREFFTAELLDTLELIDNNIIAPDIKGSWAGALGGVQFLPSNLLKYGVDGDGDGKIDLWNNPRDMFLSAGNFLKNIGWKRGQKWGREIALPKDFDYALADLSIQKPVKEWSTFGVTNADGSALPNASLSASIVVPMGAFGPKFMVYNNYRTILNWNRSTLYGLSVGILSDRLLGKRLVASLPDEANITKEDILFTQQFLNDNGFDAGPVDGILGSKTIRALKEYQALSEMIPDGYLGGDLVALMRSL